jgi:L-ascorbate metabolism protein UlaG (beta-lactamase superfamily)
MRLPADEDAQVRGVRHGAGLQGLKVMWCGHSTFLVTSPKGLRVLFDPWLTTNPSCPAGARNIGAVDVMLISHGHADHCADAVSVARETGATVVAPYELTLWLERQGVKNTRPMNIGGRQTLRGLHIAMVNAVHSSSIIDGGQNTYLGPSTGYVVRFDEGPTLYFAGDTALFGDMRLIGQRFAPGLAFLPIGDRYTMGPEDAAIAAEWVGARAIVPMHYATFPELTGTVDELRLFAEPKGIDVLELRPGQIAS